MHSSSCSFDMTLHTPQPAALKVHICWHLMHWMWVYVLLSSLLDSWLSLSLWQFVVRWPAAALDEEPVENMAERLNYLVSFLCVACEQAIKVLLKQERWDTLWRWKLASVQYNAKSISDTKGHYRGFVGRPQGDCNHVKDLNPNWK